MILLVHVDMCPENEQRFSPDGQRLGQELSSCGSAACFASLYHDYGRYCVADVLHQQILNTSRKVASKDIEVEERSAGKAASLDANGVEQSGQRAEQSREVRRGGEYASKDIGAEEEGAGKGASLDVDEHEKPGVRAGVTISICPGCNLLSKVDLLLCSASLGS